jgi:hypothetical protein
MKTAAYYTLIGAAAMGVLLMGGINRALATPTTVSFNSDLQTYVVSSTATATMYPTPEDQTNFYGKGAMMISAPVVDPGTAYASVPRAMDALFSFNTSSYVTQFNSTWGAGNWTVTGVSIELSSNYTGQGTQPNNDDFNQIASGQFTLSALGADPSIKTVTWNSLQTFLPTTTVTSAGTFYWDATQALGSNGYVKDIYTLNTNAALISGISSGELYMLGTAADSLVGYEFNTNNRIPPEISITADSYADLAPVPVPPALLLLGSGIGALAFLRRRIFA